MRSCVPICSFKLPNLVFLFPRLLLDFTHNRVPLQTFIYENPYWRGKGDHESKHAPVLAQTSERHKRRLKWKSSSSPFQNFCPIQKILTSEGVRSPQRRSKFFLHKVRSPADPWIRTKNAHFPKDFLWKWLQKCTFSRAGLEKKVSGTFFNRIVLLR